MNPPYAKPEIPVDVDLLRRHVHRLSSILPPRNHLNLHSLKLAADYISGELRQYGYQPRWQGFQVRGRDYGNVLASAGPDKGPLLVVGAHYDVCGDTPGADDNASAVAGLLELARLIARSGPEFKNRLEFAAYTLEEPPFYRTSDMGSALHARALRAAGVDVRGMICLEMLGYYDTAQGSQRYPAPGMGLIYPRKGDFIALVGTLGDRKLIGQIRRRMKEAAAIPVRTLLAPRRLIGVDFSDHRNFWDNGYQAVMVTDTAFLRNPHYHAKGDTLETLDFPRMAEVVKGLYWAIFHL